jgi:hypothetical protein
MAALRDIVLHVFEHVPGKRITTDAFHDASAAEEYLREHTDVT